MRFDSLANYRNSASYLRVGQNDIAYWQAKHSNPDAPYVCFIHGFPSASWDWQHQWRALEEKYNLIACDLLGFGISSKPHPHQYSVLEQAALVQAVLAHCHIRQCHIVAHDYGVSVAQEILSQLSAEHRLKTRFNEHTHDDAILRVLSICFLNGGLFAESHRPIFTQKLLKSPFGPLIARLMSKSTLRSGFEKVFSNHHPPSEHEIDILWDLLCFNQGKRVLPAILSYIDERSVHRDKWVTAMNDASSHSKEHTTPNSSQQSSLGATLPIGFINGVHDPVSGAHMLAQFRRLFPECPSVGIDAGHYPQLEDPAIVTSLLAHFLDTGKLSYTY